MEKGKYFWRERGFSSWEKKREVLKREDFWGRRKVCVGSREEK